jgi:hypothetical protein
MPARPERHPKEPTKGRAAQAVPDVLNGRNLMAPESPAAGRSSTAEFDLNAGVDGKLGWILEPARRRTWVVPFLGPDFRYRRWLWRPQWPLLC